MAITKPLVTTTVTVHGMNDPIVFADTVVNGKTTRDGTNARYQILHGDTVHGIEDDNGNYVEIPYHAVIMATVVTVESDPITPPEDTFCVSDGGSDNGGLDGGLAPTPDAPAN